MKNLALLVLLALLGVGLYAIAVLFGEGLRVTAMRDSMPIALWVALYIFCTGLSAGSFFVSTATGVFGDLKFKAVARKALLLAIVLLVIAPIFLLIDLGQPLRFIYPYLYRNWTSPIMYGAHLLLIYPLCLMVYGYYMMRADLIRTANSDSGFKGSIARLFALGSSDLSQESVARDARMARVFGIIGIPLAIAVHGYTGFLLGLLKARPLWNTALMPILFLTSAVVSGMALLILIEIITKKARGEEADPNLLSNMGTLMMGFLTLDLLFLGAELFTGWFAAKPEHHEVLSFLMEGSPFKYTFVWLEIIAGGLIPLLMLTPAGNRRNPAILSLASALIITGIMAMRSNIIIGGLTLPVWKDWGGLYLYLPTWVEISAALGLFSFGILMYWFGAAVLPLEVGPAAPTVKTAGRTQAVSGD